MSKRDDNLYGMYNELLEHETNELDMIYGNRTSLGSYDDDMEEFSTSEEIVKAKKHIRGEDHTARVNSDGVIEEHAHFKRYSKKRKHKYTETEMENIRNGCLATIVHDYGEQDWYHLSDEERKEHDSLSEVALELSKMTTIYSQPSKYVEAMRIVFRAWSILAEKNYVHDKDEFFELVADGTIVSSRINMPKLRKMNSYNIDTLIQYISNPELDASILDSVKDTKKKTSCDDEELDGNILWGKMFDAVGNCIGYDDEEIIERSEAKNDLEDTEEEMRMYRSLSLEELHYIAEHKDNPEKIRVNNIKRKHIKGYDTRGGLKRRKNESKKDHQFRKDLAPLLLKIQNNVKRNSSDISFMLTHGVFEQEPKEKSFWDDIHFDGSWADDDAMAILDMIIDNEISKSPVHNQRYVTYGDKELEDFFSTLEKNGMNVVDLRRRLEVDTEHMSRKKVEATKKENKKRESEILQRIVKLNDQKKFKKIIRKAEEALNDFRENERPK